MFALTNNKHIIFFWVFFLIRLLFGQTHRFTPTVLYFLQYFLGRFLIYGLCFFNLWINNKNILPLRLNFIPTIEKITILMSKSLLRIWALFACTLIILLWYSSFIKPFKCNFELKQAATKKIFNTNPLISTNINPNLLTDTLATDTLANNNLTVANALLAAPQNALTLQTDPIAVIDFPKDAFQSYDLRPVVDTSSLYILLAGDSMTEELRHGLANYCDENGYKLMTCTWYSSNTQIWSETNRLSQLIAQYQPNLILFTLGSNELFRKDIAEREQYIQDIIYEADRTKTPFVWLNPPAWKDDTGISELIKKNVGVGRHFDSRGLKMQRKSDGAHPTKDGAQVWADSIVGFLKIKSYYKPLFAYFSLNLADKLQKSYKIQALDTVLSARQTKATVRILKDTEQNPNNIAQIAANTPTEPKNIPSEPKNIPSESKNIKAKSDSIAKKSDSTLIEPKNTPAEPENRKTKPENTPAKSDSTKGKN